MKEIFVVQCGAHTPVGDRAGITASSVRTNICRIIKHADFTDRQLEPVSTGQIEYLDEEDLNSRFMKMAKPALKEAIVPLLGIEYDQSQIPLLIGLPEPRPGISDKIESFMKESILKMEKEEGINFEIGFVHEGHSAGLIAMEKVIDKMTEESLDFCMIGGIDSYMSEDTIEWIEDRGRLYSSKNRDGFIPGESAGFVLLASDQAVKKYSLPVLAQVLGVSSATEEKSRETGAVGNGQGLVSSLKKTIETVPKGIKLNKVYYALNRERYHNNEYAYLVMCLGDRFENPSDLVTPYDCMGDIGAATAPILIALATESAKRGYAPGPYTPLITSSLGKARASALLKLNIISKRGRRWEK